MKSRDFSAPATGRRLRLTLGVYHPGSKQFRHVKGVSARVTVKNAAEQHRLWKAIENTIAGETWRSRNGESGEPVGAAAGAADAESGRVATGS